MRTLILGFVLVAAGCNNNKSNGDGGTGADVMKACADESNAVCALRDMCGPNFVIAKNFGDIATCQTRTTSTCVNALNAKGSGNNATHVEACAAAYPSESCTDFRDGNPVAACVAPMGQLANGAACGASGQCASTYCAIPQYSVCGTCQTLPAAGAPCQVQSDCGRDLACATPTVAVADAGVPTSGTCAAFVDTNGACLTGFHPCKFGLACVGDDPTTMTMGTCQAQGATTGAACDSTRKTMANCYGDSGFVCIPSSKGSKGVGTCQPIMLVGNGAACGSVGSMPITGFNDCSGGGLCMKAATDTTGTCVAPAADGAACDNDPSIGPPCLAPAQCVIPSGSSGTAGTCTIPNATLCM
jgi:hypothetical protein